VLDYIASIFVRCLNILFFFVPISATLWLGRRLGSIAFFVNKKRRMVAYANLKAAFAKEKSPAELRKLTKKVYQNMVQTFVEILNLTKVDKKYAEHYVGLERFDRVQKAVDSGKGVIFLTAHFGDWELLSLKSAMVGLPILVLVREQKMKRLNGLLNRLRESKGCKVVRKGMETKQIIRALRSGEIVGILSDQDAGKKGTFVTFFGRPTSTHSGPVEMALHTGSIILPNFIVRTKGPYHKVFLEDYITLKDPADPDAVRDGVQQYMTLLEGFVRKYPEQWLWLHKRWKSTPVRTVLVLNDGKAGHLNQSLAVARAIQRARTTQGYRFDDTKIVTVDVKYKTKFARAVLLICARLASWRCHGRMWAMRACLEKPSYETLMKTYAEFVVSCGSATAPANIFMAKENDAKNVIIMKPSPILGARKFSLCIIPEHDRPAKRKNVVKTVLAPNLMSVEALRTNGDKLRGYAKTAKGNVVGVLIGGDNAEFALTPRIAEDLARELLEFAKKRDAELLVTTSRRTSVAVESVLKHMLKDDPRGKLLVIANEKNAPEVMPGILDISNIIVVSGESISMVSEAISSGKKTIAFSLEKRARGATKHERALESLADGGYLDIARAEELARSLEDALGRTQSAKKPDDDAKILEAVRRLI